MEIIASTKYVKKYFDKMSNRHNIDIDLLETDVADISTLLDETKEIADSLERESVFTLISKSSFCKSYFATGGYTYALSNRGFSTSSNFTSSTTTQGDTSTTITVGSGITEVKDADISFGNASVAVIHSYYSSESALYNKIIGGNNNNLVISADITTSLPNAKFGVFVYASGLESNYAWIENFILPTQYEDYNGSGTVNVMVNVKDMVDYINKNESGCAMFNINFTFYPVIASDISVDSFTIDISSIKYDFLSGTETVSTGSGSGDGGTVTVDLSNYYTKAQTDNAINQAILNEFYISEAVPTTVSIPVSQFTNGYGTTSAGEVTTRSDTHYGDMLDNHVDISSLELYDRVFTFTYSTGSLFVNEWTENGTFVKQTSVGNNGTVTMSDLTSYFTLTCTWTVTSSLFGYTYNALSKTSKPITGTDGKSAYEIAVENGFTGTETEWLASLKGADGTDGKDGTNGTNGTNGEDGYSPTARVSKSGTTATISITDKNGTTTATVSDGTDGKDGVDGTTPTVSFSKVGKVTTITVTDADGTKTGQISDGADGVDGKDGKDGVDGKDYAITIVDSTENTIQLEKDTLYIITTPVAELNVTFNVTARTDIFHFRFTTSTADFAINFLSVNEDDAIDYKGVTTFEADTVYEGNLLDNLLIIV